MISSPFSTPVLISLLLGSIGLYIIGPALPPFIGGFLIASLLRPGVDFLVRQRLPRWLAVLLVIGAFFTLLIGALIIVIPLLEEQLLLLAQNLPLYGRKIEGAMVQYLEHLDLQFWAHKIPFLERLLPEGISLSEPASLGTWSHSYLGDIFAWIGHILKRLLMQSAALASAIGVVIITPIVAFFFLLDWKVIMTTAQALIPQRFRSDLLSLLHQMAIALGNYARGQSLVCLLFSLYYSIALSLIGVSSGFLVGAATGLAICIPFIGIGIGLLLSLALAWIQGMGSESTFWILGVFAVGQAFDGAFLTPRLVGKSLGIHPLWILFALIVGAHILGFLGVLLAMPMVAILSVLVRFLYGWYIKSPFFRG